MGNIIIRDMEIGDVADIKAAMTDVWGYSDFTKDEEVLSAAVGLDFNQVLHGATFMRIATIDDKVVGVVAGIVKNQTPSYRHYLENGTELAMVIAKKASSMIQKAIYEYLSKQREVYVELLKEAKEDYDGTLEFLLLSEKAQGLGIGKKLYTALMDYFEETRAKSIYLFTDTHSNFGFYEHLGWSRRLEYNAVFKFGPFGLYKMKIMNYLYDIKVGI